jgi:hypothetical protein
MNRSRWFVVSVLAFLACAGRADAGLVIEVDPKIDGKRVESLAIDRGYLVVRYSGDGDTERRVLQLPPGALPWIAYWAAGKSDGPLVISVDSSFENFGQTYVPPYLREFPKAGSLPNPLGQALIEYDVYAHSITHGGLPLNTRTHPLIARLGNDSGMPHRQHDRLMDRDNLKEEAVTYRRLTERYTLPPGEGAVGELVIRVKPTRDGYPLRLEVEPLLTVLTHAWYRPIVVPSEWDRAVALLPYATLHRDMQEHWADYRKAFRPMEEVSSVAEAFAVLRAVNRQNPQVWAVFHDRLTQGLTDREFKQNGLPRFYASRGLELVPPLWSLDRWNDAMVASVGDRIDTTAKADMALALLVERPFLVKAENQNRWQDQLKARAKEDARLEAKLALYEALRADPGTDDLVTSAARFFELTKARRELFRLRVQGLKRLDNYLDTIDSKIGDLKQDYSWPSLQKWADAANARVIKFDDLIVDERKAVVSAFRSQVAAAVARSGAKPDLALWEELSQNVYSVDLHSLLGGNSLDADTIRLLARIHYHRGMSPQVGKEFDYMHANFRYLGYLAARAPNQQLAKEVRLYQAELARCMNLVGWEEQ